MTVIIGLRLPPSEAAPRGSVIIGGDRLGTSYTPQMTRIPRADPKVFRNGPYIFGTSGDYALPQILSSRQDLPEPPRSTKPRKVQRWLTRTMKPELRRIFEEEGFERGGPDCKEFFLVGWGPHLYAWWLGTNQYIKSEGDFEVIGSGADVAYGVMRATSGFTLDPRERIWRAISIAAERCGTVGGEPLALSTAP